MALVPVQETKRAGAPFANPGLFGLSPVYIKNTIDHYTFGHTLCDLRLKTFFLPAASSPLGSAASPLPLCACGADSMTAVLPLRQAFGPPTPLCNPRRSRVEKLDSVQTTTLQAKTLCTERL